MRLAGAVVKRFMQVFLHKNSSCKCMCAYATIPLMAQKTEETRKPTSLFIRPSLWQRVRVAAAQRNVSLWQAVEAGLELWIKTGKAGA